MKSVAILMGSKSDYEVMSEAARVLEGFGIKYKLTITSTHRSPKRTKDYVREAEQKGAKVFIATAGMAVYLAGAVAAYTTKPVLGVPMSGTNLGSMDSLFSTVQMPSGIPVGTLTIGRAGAMNAAYLVMQILAFNDENLAKASEGERKTKGDRLIKDPRSVEVIL